MAEAKAIIRTRIRVTGRVQGVYFRASTRDTARRLGLVGWVRNCDDGSVEIEVEGPEQRVAQFVDWAHEGPPAARVSSVVEVRIDALATESEFHVR